jgi:hypothetical protein
MKVAVLNFYYLNYQKSVEKTEIFKSVQFYAIKTVLYLILLNNAPSLTFLNI